MDWTHKSDDGGGPAARCSSTDDSEEEDERREIDGFGSCSISRDDSIVSFAIPLTAEDDLGFKDSFNDVERCGDGEVTEVRLLKLGGAWPSLLLPWPIVRERD